MLLLLCFFMYVTTISFISGFVPYWWHTDKVKSVTAGIVLLLCHVIGWYKGYTLVIDETESLLCLIAWCFIVFMFGFKVRTFVNKKIVTRRRR